MKRSLIVTAALLTLSSLVTTGCGKSSPAAATSLSRLNNVSQSQPMNQAGYQEQVGTPLNGALGTNRTTGTMPVTAPGSLLLALSSLKVSGVTAVEISVTGPGLAQPIGQRLTSSELQTSNTLAFENVPSGALTATLTAFDVNGGKLGTKSTQVIVKAAAETKVQLALKIDAPIGTGSAKFDFAIVNGEAPSTTSPNPTTPSEPEADDDGMLEVEVVKTDVVRKFLLFKKLAVTFKVTNTNRSTPLNGEVKVEFHKLKGLIMKEDVIVQTLTAPVEDLAPGKSVEITLTSTVAADAAEATVHTVVGSSVASSD